MTKQGRGSIVVPNPHRGDIGIDLLRRALRIANISLEDWERA
jgi:hypothetical protein